MTWREEILPWKNVQGWCKALALIFFWGMMETAVKVIEKF